MAKTKSTIQIAIADDHPIFRKGLRTILESNKEFAIIGEAANGADAVALIETETPDVAILDIEMPVKSGVEVVESFRHKNIATAFVFLTMLKEKDLFDEAMELGVKGYVLKDSALMEIAECVRTVAKGEFYISPVLSSFIILRSATIKQFKKKNPAFEKLTSTEMRVVKLVAEHKTSKEIASDMNISVRTVEHHRGSITEKLKLKGSQALLKFALENKRML